MNLPIVCETECSLRRKDYLYRNLRIMSFYNLSWYFSQIGLNKLGTVMFEKGGKEETKIRTTIDGVTYTSSFQTLAGMHSATVNELGNLVLLSLYGNFEGYLYDILYDHFTEKGSDDPQQDAVDLISRRRWEGKFARLSNEIGIQVKRSDIDIAISPVRSIQFLDGNFPDCVSFLDCISEVRHRIAHSGGRADQQLAEKFPQCSFQVGKYMNFQFGVNFMLAFIFQQISGLVDLEVSKVNGVERKKIDASLLMDWVDYSVL